MLLALLALVGVVFLGWQWWQGRSHEQRAHAEVAQMRQKLDAMRQSVSAEKQQREAQGHAQQQAQTDREALKQQVAGLSNRLGDIDNAVAALARQNENSHDALLLDQAAMLMRMGQQRYALFHDLTGADKALGMAQQTLAAVNDPALQQVRQTLNDERKALAAAHPSSRRADLAALADLRADIATLPLKPLDAESDANADQQGFWSRVWHALSTAVVIRRDDGSMQSVADARLTRQMAALDVAEAQSARLAWDAEASHAALQRVAKALEVAFDTRDADVRKAQADVARLLAEKPGAPPQLGKALQQLDDLRDVRKAAAPASSAAVPSRATSTSQAPAPATSSAPAPASSSPVAPAPARTTT